MKYKSSKEILDISIEEFQGLSRKELGKYVTQLSSAANKRIRRLEESDIMTPALDIAQQSGGNFTGKGKDINELRAEFMRIKKFMESKTSSKRGYTRYKNEFFKRVQASKKVQSEFTNDDLRDFWRLYNEFPTIETFVKGSDISIKFIFDVYVKNKELDKAALMNIVNDKLKSFYESQQQLLNESEDDEYIEI